MNTAYFCSICNTTPDQLSHHKAHMKTQKHITNCENYKKDLSIFSFYKIINTQEWDKSQYKDYIIEVFKQNFVIEPTFDTVKKWIDTASTIYPDKYSNWVTVEVFVEYSSTKDEKVFISPMRLYHNETGKSAGYDDIDFRSWCIKKIIQHKEKEKENGNEKCDKCEQETSVKTIIKHKSQNQNQLKSLQRGTHRIRLSRMTNVNVKILEDIKINKIDLSYFSFLYLTQMDEKSLHFLLSNNLVYKQCEKPSFYDDVAIRYAHILVCDIGYNSLFALLNGECFLTDPVEHPEDIEYYYFYKRVNFTTKIDGVTGYNEPNLCKTDNVWVKCELGNFIDNNFDSNNNNKFVESSNTEFLYVDVTDLKIHFRDALINFYERMVRRLRELIINISNYNNSIENDFYSKTENDPALFNDINKGKYEYLLDCLIAEYKEASSNLNYIRNLSVNSDIFNNIVKFCEYFFEYNTELINYYAKTEYNIFLGSSHFPKLISYYAKFYENSNIDTNTIADLVIKEMPDDDNNMLCFAYINSALKKLENERERVIETFITENNFVQLDKNNDPVFDNEYIYYTNINTQKLARIDRHYTLKDSDLIFPCFHLLPNNARQNNFDNNSDLNDTI
jgi:hypothetical protein